MSTFLPPLPFQCPQSFPVWETDNKISCEQTLQKGDGPKTSWTREITSDGKLILVRQSECPLNFMRVMFLYVLFRKTWGSIATATNLQSWQNNLKEQNYSNCHTCGFVLSFVAIFYTFWHTFSRTLVTLWSASHKKSAHLDKKNLEHCNMPKWGVMFFILLAINWRYFYLYRLYAFIKKHLKAY